MSGGAESKSEAEMVERSSPSSARMAMRVPTWRFLLPSGAWVKRGARAVSFEGAEEEAEEERRAHAEGERTRENSL